MHTQAHCLSRQAQPLEPILMYCNGIVQKNSVVYKINSQWNAFVKKSNNAKRNNANCN